MTNAYEEALEWTDQTREMFKMVDREGRQELGDGKWIEHGPGGSWWKVPAPSKNHEHKWQTRGVAGPGSDYIERCSCGAASEGDGIWFFIGHDEPRVPGEDEKKQPRMRSWKWLKLR